MNECACKLVRCLRCSLVLFSLNLIKGTSGELGPCLSDEWKTARSLLRPKDIIDTEFVIESSGAASDGEVASLLDTSGALPFGVTGVLSYTFEGLSGDYDLSLTVFDENDGASPIEVRVNGTLVQTFTLDQNTTTPGSFTVPVTLTISGLTLSTNDVITFTGTQTGGEWVRTDFIAFVPLNGLEASVDGGTPAPSPTPQPAPSPSAAINVGVNEVEGLDLTNFNIEGFLVDASGGANVVINGSDGTTGTASGVFPGSLRHLRTFH